MHVTQKHLNIELKKEKRQLVNYHSPPPWLISQCVGPKCHIMLVIHHPWCTFSSLLAADEWFLCLTEYPTALGGSDLCFYWPLTPPLLSPSPPSTLPYLPVPWLAVLLLYITLPKCNLLKHALTQLLIVELKKKQKKKSKNQTTSDWPLFLWRTSRLHALSCVLKNTNKRNVLE